jgi:hypothetical protein
MFVDRKGCRLEDMGHVFHSKLVLSLPGVLYSTSQLSRMIDNAMPFAGLTIRVARIPFVASVYFYIPIVPQSSSHSVIVASRRDANHPRC